jgi:hypothetical protein|tara:strand:+ start:146 stop:442 length:297 start_codon:yes stop_codon:yes gene_type:complete
MRYRSYERTPRNSRELSQSDVKLCQLYDLVYFASGELEELNGEELKNHEYSVHRAERLLNEALEVIGDIAKDRQPLPVIESNYFTSKADYYRIEKGAL